MNNQQLDLQIQELKEKIEKEKQGIEETKIKISALKSLGNKANHDNLTFCTKTVNENVSIVKTALTGLVGAVALFIKARK